MTSPAFPGSSSISTPTVTSTIATFSTRFRSWRDRREYGFVSAGGDEKYSRPLQRLKLGDRLFAYIKGHGYVGFGQVTQERVPAAEFIPDGQGKPLPQLDLKSPVRADPPRDGSEEYAVGVCWIDSVDKEHAKRFAGAFANQNVVGAGPQVAFGPVAGVGTADNSRAARFFGHGQHSERGFAHAQKAHLAQVVEVILE